MTGAPGGSAGRVWLVCLALALAACGAGSSSSQTTGGPTVGPQGSTPPRDTFTGRIVSGTRTYSGGRGTVRVYLHPRGSGRKRSVLMVFVGGCTGSARCVRLQGTARGTLAILAGGLPDTGHEYQLSGTGQVSPLGRVAIQGTVAAPGFIARARELLKLTFTGPSGRVALVAYSGPVKGFTSP